MFPVLCSILSFSSFFIRAEGISDFFYTGRDSLPPKMNFNVFAGLLPPGLISLKKCNKYHNAHLPAEDFAPLTKEDLDLLNLGEMKYIPALGIAGGQIAFPKQLPFMAALGYEDDGQKIFACGGTLISENFVLTAAHCIHSKPWGRVKYIRLGDLNLTNPADDEVAQEFQLKRAYVYPYYKYPIKYHDIALIELDGTADITGYVSPACLEPVRVDIRYETFYVGGWGNLGYGEDASDHLRVATLTHFSGVHCQETFPADSVLPGGIKLESQICAGGLTYKTDTCEGDSGGPLAYRYHTTETNFFYMVAGITSFGKACAFAPIPAVYTRVAYYTDWIERIIWSSELNDDDFDKIYFPDDLRL